MFINKAYSLNNGSFKRVPDNSSVFKIGVIQAPHKAELKSKKCISSHSERQGKHSRTQFDSNLSAFLSYPRRKHKMDGSMTRKTATALHIFAMDCCACLHMMPTDGSSIPLENITPA